MGEFSHLNGLMFDIETAAQSPNSAILSLGAVRFNIDSGKIGDEFYVTIDLKDSLDRGLVYDKDTLAWWKEQDPAVVKALFHNTKPFNEAMEMIYGYFKKGPKKEPIWAWGPHFDLPILEFSLRKFGLGTKELPWKYYSVFDARTVLNVFGEKIERSKTAHNALDDVKDQAKYLINFFNNLEEDDDIPF